MDEMKLNLGSRFMRKIAAKLIRNFIKKQFGCDTELELNEIKFTYLNGDVVVKTNLELKMNRHEAKKLLTKIEDEIDD